MIKFKRKNLMGGGSKPTLGNGFATLSINFGGVF